MPYGAWILQVTHTPQIGAPVADDGTVRVACIIDNPGNAPAFGLVWQRADTDLPDKWSWIGGSFLWQLFRVPAMTVQYRHSDGSMTAAKFDTIVDQYGDEMIFAWIPKMNELLNAFFRAETGSTTPLTGIELLIDANKKLVFSRGQIERLD
jgi:hypothetical protein